MGRPLKIAKAVLLTLTDTVAATDQVTVSQNLNTLNVLRGMTFTPATTVGGLTGGTVYWILEITGNNTFTVSATSPDANTKNTVVALSDTSGGSVTLSVGRVDYAFSNPDGSNTATNSTSYGAVGGNTAIYGPQALVRVAIGVAGTGVITSDTGSAAVYGGGTDFANTVSVGSAIQDAEGNQLGFVSSVTGLITLNITDTVETGSYVVTDDDATDFTVDQPVVFDGDIGGLTAGTVYYVQDIANTTHFNVATQPGGTPYLVADETTTVSATQDVLTLGAVATATNSTAVAWVYANDEAGYILRQKGKTKYLVQGGTTGLVAQCYTANVANTALTPNTMNILATYANSSTAYIQSLNDYQSQVFYDTSNANANPDVIATFGTAYAANTYGGQPNPIVTISNA